MSSDRKLCVVCSKVYRSELTTCPDDGATLVIEARTDARTPRIGAVIGNYRLLRILGEGGVGTVYEAEHVQLGRHVALKLLHADVVNDELVTRFFNEARAVNEIRHPNIVDVEDFVTTPDGEHYMLMELLDGEDLRTVLAREGKLAPARVAAIGAQVASALAAVHAVGIIHRDLKPDNIFLVQRDGKEHATLLDFGIAKFTDEASGVTRAGMTMGTPQYMAPEQIITGRQAGLGSDVYALGMVMYECLTGAPAFGHTNLALLLRAHCFDPVVRPSERRGERIPPVIEAAVMKCLEKDPDDRFLSAGELAEALYADRPVAYTSPTSRRAASRRRGRSVQMLPALAMAVAALVLHVWPRDDVRGAAAATKPAVAATKPAVTATTPPRPPAPPVAVTVVSPAAPATPVPAAPATPTSIEIELTSDPDGAELFLGSDRTPIGIAPMTATIPRSSEPVTLTARFPDGREAVETIVPDRPHPTLALTEPPAPAAKRPGAKTVKPATPARKSRPGKPARDDRDGTLDPFNP